MVKSLDEIAINFSTDKATKHSGVSTHGYTPIYDKLLSKWRYDKIRLLEVGVCMETDCPPGGHSVRMWLEYFEKAKIYAFDIVDLSKYEPFCSNERVKFFRGDQGNNQDFIDMYASFGNEDFDFILEDGSHQHHHQIISLGRLFKYVKSGGHYILEDMSIPGHSCCCIRNDETYGIIKNLKDRGRLHTPFLSDEECQYLIENINSIEIHHDIQDAYAVAIITKK